MSATKNVGATGGPRTVDGKKRSRWNARKSGLQSKVLAVSKEDVPEFDSMRSALRDDLQPESPVQILFDEIVAAAWQMKQTTAFVQAEAARRFAPAEQSATERPPTSYPYPFSAGEIRSRLKILDELQEAIRRDQFVHPRYEQMITRLFGAEFWATLTKWEPPSRVTLFSQKLAAVVHERSQIFNHELPIEPPTEEEKSTLAADYKARTQMIDKLVDLKKNYLLLDLHRAHGIDGEASSAEPSGRLDLALRYHTKARRDFYRALEEYEKYSGKQCLLDAGE